VVVAEAPEMRETVARDVAAQEQRLRQAIEVVAAVAEHVARRREHKVMAEPLEAAKTIAVLRERSPSPGAPKFKISFN